MSAPALVRVWEEMADHFLDTDNREYLGRTARLCLEAGLSLEQARAVWRYDVSRAVALNLWGIGGQWAGFDNDWLIPRIQRLRSRWDNVPGTGRWLRYWMRSAIGTDRTWKAIAGFMQLALRESEPDLRAQRASDLERLARVYFALDSGTVAFVAPNDDTERQRLAALYHECFQALVAPVRKEGEHESMHRRVLWMLDGGPEPTPW